MEQKIEFLIAKSGFRSQRGYLPLDRVWFIGLAVLNSVFNLTCLCHKQDWNLSWTGYGMRGVSFFSSPPTWALREVERVCDWAADKQRVSSPDLYNINWVNRFVVNSLGKNLIENWSSTAQVFLTTAKWVISRRCLDEGGCEMCRNWNRSNKFNRATAVFRH